MVGRDNPLESFRGKLKTELWPAEGESVQEAARNAISSALQEMFHLTLCTENGCIEFTGCLLPLSDVHQVCQWTVFGILKSQQCHCAFCRSNQTR